MALAAAVGSSVQGRSTSDGCEGCDRRRRRVIGEAAEVVLVAVGDHQHVELAAGASAMSLASSR